MAPDAGRTRRAGKAGIQSAIGRFSGCSCQAKTKFVLVDNIQDSITEVVALHELPQLRAVAND
jgi:hypothetical protein